MPDDNVFKLNKPEDDPLQAVLREGAPNPIESVFATVRLRTARTKNCGSRMTTLTRAFKLMETAQRKWFRLRGYNLLAEVINNIKFVNRIKQTADQKQNVA